MVSIHSIKTLCAVSVFIMSMKDNFVQSAPLKVDPYTDTGVFIPLNHKHPAFGGQVPEKAPPIEIVEDENEKIAEALPIVNNTAVAVNLDSAEAKSELKEVAENITVALPPVVEDDSMDGSGSNFFSGGSTALDPSDNTDLNAGSGMGGVSPSNVDMIHVFPMDKSDGSTGTSALNQPIRQNFDLLTDGKLDSDRVLEVANSDLKNMEIYFKEPLENNFHTLKEKYSKGAPKDTPWPSSYWPLFMDGINVRWHKNEPSPSEKYALAFGHNVTELQDKISLSTGIDSIEGLPECTVDSDCTHLKDGSKCAIRDHKTKGVCMQTWYGICHAWAPAAGLEPEPECDVVHNGITFHPLDIKALITQVYDGSALNTVFTGARFASYQEPTKDKYGRYEDPVRRDTSPGFFHIALSHIMGKHQRSFVVDVEAGREVWNQPAAGYEVLEMELVDPKVASLEWFGTDVYPFNSEISYLAYTKTRFSWMVEGYEDGPYVSQGKADEHRKSVDYQYLLELDKDYKIVGGEWLNVSNDVHPDFLWLATERPSLETVTSVGLAYAEVRELLEASVRCDSKTEVTTPKPPTLVPTTPVPLPPSTVDDDDDDDSMIEGEGSTTTDPPVLGESSLATEDITPVPNSELATEPTPTPTPLATPKETSKPPTLGESGAGQEEQTHPPTPGKPTLGESGAGQHEPDYGQGNQTPATTKPQATIPTIPQGVKCKALRG